MSIYIKFLRNTNHRSLVNIYIIMHNEKLFIKEMSNKMQILLIIGQLN